MSSAECGLTLPSRGCPKGCAFCAPLMSNVRRRQYSAAGCSSVCSLPSRGVGSQSRSRCGSPERMSKTSAHPPKQVQSLRNRRCGRSVLRRPAHDRSVRKQNNPTRKQFLAARRRKALCGQASQSAVSTRSACLPPSRSCTLHACKSVHCSVQVSARRRCSPRQVAAVAKGRRLTLPSSGQSKGCALCLPLMSNVRRRQCRHAIRPAVETLRLGATETRLTSPESKGRS